MDKILFAALVMIHLAVGGTTSAHAQAAPAVTLDASELHQFEAKDGSAYQVYVAFPLGYQPEGDAKYPVIYMTDPSGYFALVAQALRVMELDGDLPPMILVGFERKTASQMETMMRRFIDLTPMRDPKREQDLLESFKRKVETGKGGANLAALRDEIIPWVEARYPTSAERALIGYSLGGLFAMYAMLDAPGTFTHYLLGSPSLYWNGEVMFAHEKAYAAKHKDMKARVFVGVGADEQAAHVGNVAQFAETLQDRNYPGLALQRDIFPNQIHTSGIGATMSRGLLWLFGTDETK
jgi:predicted alpha/beta superfamily hydrolase